MAPSPTILPASKTVSPDPADDTAGLVDRILRGERAALAEMFLLYRPRLWRMANFRLHPKLQGRLDADDILQEAWLRAVDRIGYFLRDATDSCYIWFRMIVEQTMIDLQRKHLGAEKRNAARETSLYTSGASDGSSTLALFLSAQLSSPSSVVCRLELSRRLDAVLRDMPEIDREVLMLRHFEELSNGEVAKVLQMSEQAASIRYVRALKRLKAILQVLPDFAGERR